MAVKTIYTCDICGAVKDRTNYWYMASMMLKGMDATDENCILLWPFAASKLNNKNILCSQACVLSFVSQNFLTLSSTEREASSTRLTDRTALPIPPLEEWRTSLGIDRLLDKYKNPGGGDGDDAF